MTDYGKPRREMIQRLASSLVFPVPPSPRVLAAMSEIPRHQFVEKALWHRAYTDSSLPIGRGQTLSQPSTVLACLSIVEPRETDVMLEVGSGSGYLAAVAGRMCSRVYGVEAVLDLVLTSRKVIDGLGLTNIRISYGDGSSGLEEHAPYDCIILSAVSSGIHPGIFSQLSEGGRLGAPVETASGQEFRFFVKRGGSVEEYGTSFPCRFVPLTGRFGSCG